MVLYVCENVQGTRDLCQLLVECYRQFFFHPAYNTLHSSSITTVINIVFTLFGFPNNTDTTLLLSMLVKLTLY